MAELVENGRRSRVIGNLEGYGYRDPKIKLVTNTGNGRSAEQKIIDAKQDEGIEINKDINLNQEHEIAENASGITENKIAIGDLNEKIKKISGGTDYDAGEWN